MFTTRMWFAKSSRSMSRLFALLAFGLPACSLGASSDPIEFFNTRVRPILASHCVICHTDAKMGGLQLDSREHALKGGNSGPAIVPGNAEQSLLIRAVSHTHERLKMPPNGKLTGEQISDLRQWVDAGAHWGDAAATPVSKKSEYVITSEQRAFWAFQPVRKPAIPEVRNKAWTSTPIDRFIVARLEAKGLQPVKAADKSVLIRRATFDLTGLPPTPAEIDAFLDDPSSKAFVKVVDRLLASPHYGERWGRIWLDVARYADEDASGVAAEPFPNAFRYRDWVIKAFNDDMPYDLFVKAQIAGDLIEKDPSNNLRAGLGLFALGPWYYKIVEPAKARADERHDRLDVLTRGFLGLTAACARCHDHKYDPISTRDYYALSGVFANTDAEEFPLAPQAVVNAYKDQEKKVADEEKVIKEFLEATRAQLAEDMAEGISKYLMAAWSGDAAGLDRETLDRWKQYLKAPEKAHPLLRAWEQKAIPGADAAAVRKFAQDFQALVISVLEEKKSIEEYNRRVMEESKNSKDPYDIFCKGCRAVTKALERDRFVLWTDLFAAKQRTFEKEPGVLFYADEEIDRWLSAEQKAKFDGLRAELKWLKAAMPEHYPFLHTIADVQTPVDLKLHLRGDPYNLGDAIPRQFLAILSDPQPTPFRHGSGRLELAEAIANPRNPLTARVMVNRVWQHHFGQGIVRTPSNFGKVGDRPSHPELLDYLATRFVENNWSVKALHREIMLSATYALSSDYSATNFAQDPENRLFWRANRRRLDIEALRDALLFVAGNLDLTAGGTPQEWNDKNKRRTVYGKVSRHKLERMLSLFDFPDPMITCEQRASTNVPLQRLFFLNSELMTEEAKVLAGRLKTDAPDNSARIQTAYRMLFGRKASESEVRTGVEFLRAATEEDGSPEMAWQQYAQVLLGSNEFSFVD